MCYNDDIVIVCLLDADEASYHMSNLRFTCSKTTAEADSEEIDQEIDREYDVADELQEEGAALRFYVDELADASEQLTALSTDRHQACFGDLEPPMTSHYLSELAIAALSESNSESLLQVLPARTGAEPKCPTYICPVACETTYDRMHAQDFSFLLQQISAAKLSDNFFDQIASTADDNFFDRPFLARKYEDERVLSCRDVDSQDITNISSGNPGHRRIGGRPQTMLGWIGPHHKFHRGVMYGNRFDSELIGSDRRPISKLEFRAHQAAAAAGGVFVNMSADEFCGRNGYRLVKKRKLEETSAP